MSEQFYWTSQEKTAGRMTLDMQSGLLAHIGTDIALPVQEPMVAIENSLKELEFVSVLANRNLETGDLTLEPNRFPSESGDVQTLFVNPNGKYAYAAVVGPVNSSDDSFPVLLHIYQRQADDNFTLLQESTIGQGGDISAATFVFLGVVKNGSTNYLVVTRRQAGHPGTFPQLMLWPLSAEGDQIGDALPIIGGEDDRITVGWSGNLFVSQAFIESFPNYIQAVTRISDGITQQIAACDAKAATPCPALQSIAVAPNQQYAYGIALSSTALQLLQISWNESDGTMAFSDTGIAPNNAGDQIFVDPSGQYLLEATGSSRQVRVFRIDGANGVLTEVAGSPFPAPGTILDLAFVPQP